MSNKPRQISIWFFIGVLLTIYGVIILAAGISDWVSPGPRQVVLAELRVGVWWGALLVIIGCVYSFVFAPNKLKK
jgi:hypothetical protein